MNPINLYALTRVSDYDISSFIKTHRVMAQINEDAIIREHEKNDLKIFVDFIMNNNENLNIVDGFYYSYVIPQIGKEFDLLKFDNDNVLNIEIKNQDVSENSIISQLEKNRYYLGHLGKNIISLTFIASLQKLFLYEKGKLENIDVKQLIEILKSFSTTYKTKIDELFKVSQFLVSPLNNPDKFLNNNYFLTQQQTEIKNDILKSIDLNSNRIFKIVGNAGTGKTLLLYDIAKSLLSKGSVCIVHSGILCSGHNYLNNNSSIQIISAKEVKSKDLSIYDYILIDESHRLYQSIFNFLLDSNKSLIFSIDSNQILSRAEKRRDISGLMSTLKNLKSFELTKKIRTNKELASFIINMFDTSKKNPNLKYKNIELFFTNNIQETKNLITYLANKNYTFINYTPSINFDNRLDNFKILTNNNTHRVIGQEFDNVVMYLDDNFYYESNKLNSRYHRNPDYLYDRLFFQGVTRVREKLAIIVYDNPQVYEILMQIVINDN